MIQWSTWEVTRVPGTQKQKEALLPHIEKNNKLRDAAVVTRGVSLYQQFGGVFDAYMGSRKQLYKTWGGQAGGSGKGLFWHCGLRVICDPRAGKRTESTGIGGVGLLSWVVHVFFFLYVSRAAC